MVNADSDATTPLDDARGCIVRIMALHPDLSADGLGIGTLARQADPELAFRDSRNMLLTDDACRQFTSAVAWLNQCTRTANINWRRSSYALKDEVEGWASHYVSNGAFIAAAIHLGYKTGRVGDSPNVCLNISTKGRP